MDTNEMIALLLPPNGCYKCSDTRKEIAEELARRAAAQPVAWATPSLLVTLSAVEKNHLTNPDRRTRGGEFESAARDAERYSVPLYAAPPAQAEPQEGDLLHTMMEWARTEEGRKQLADAYRPRLWACAKRVADPQNEAATCRHWCGDIEHCQPIASAPAQAEPQPVSVPYELIAHDKPQPRCGWMHAGDQCTLAHGHVGPCDHPNAPTEPQPATRNTSYGRRWNDGTCAMYEAAKDLLADPEMQGPITYTWGVMDLGAEGKE